MAVVAFGISNRAFEARPGAGNGLGMQFHMSRQQVPAVEDNIALGTGMPFGLAVIM
jgi:hypothetical protein